MRYFGNKPLDESVWIYDQGWQEMKEDSALLSGNQLVTLVESKVRVYWGTGEAWYRIVRIDGLRVVLYTEDEPDLEKWLVSFRERKKP